MITLPPSEHDLHAYVDHQLNDDDRLRMEAWLSSHPEVARQVSAWQQDAQHLRAAMSGELKRPANPALDPAAVRQGMQGRRRRHFATAAMLLVALGCGGLGGWQAREMTRNDTNPPMADALQAYRLFATGDDMASDWNAQRSADPQGWLDQHFAQADRLPNLDSAGFNPVSARMTTTDQGAAALVVYKDNDGRTLSFYIRPPGARNHLLPRGTRIDGDLQADYWSGAGYNYAMVTPVGDPVVQKVRLGLRG
jgi:anti-sigma factor RsiW